MTTPAIVALPVAPTGSGATYRHWRGLEDIEAMGVANAALRLHIGLLEPIDLDAMRHQHTHLVNSDPAVDCILVERDGAVRGYTRVEWHDLADGDRVYDTTTVLEPSAWGLGIDGAMIRWAEARAAELAREHPTDRRSHVSNYVFSGDVELARALEELGYAAVRWDAEMFRPDLEDLPEPIAPDGYELRTPETSELPAVHAMYVAAFNEHWGEWEDAEQDLSEWVDDPRFRRELVAVAWAGDRPVAALSNIVETRPDGSRRGLLESLGVHPDHRRRGLARAVMARSLELLRAEGATWAYLGVDTDNPNQALSLYESFGFRTASVSTSYRKPLPGQEATP